MNNQLDLPDYLLPDFDTHRLLFINGSYVEQWPTIHYASDTIVIGSLRQAIKQIPKQVFNWFHQTDKNNNKPFSKLNTALLNDGSIIHINNQITLDKPVEIIYINTSESIRSNTTDNNAIMSQTRNIISLGSDAKMTLVERFIGTDQSQYFHNNLSVILLGKGASLKHYRIQEESSEAFHLSNINISQQQSSRYHHCNITLGGTWSKTDINVNFTDEKAECLLNGLYVVGDQQLSDLHLDVRHSVPSCTSREQFKGILYGKGRAVFDGHILVEKQAQHSDAQLSNHNLMLTRDAEVDTKPQLEIYADDVKCRHGTTVGQIDPQQLFYMRSRGLSETTAYKLLCLGFAGEIIDSIEEEKLSEHIYKRLVQTFNEHVFQQRLFNGN
ncbi:MAG: Fe-S cluster assembly protein SufD [gamma proteobacterium symbiont of Bathyaustriella thionipta]|nr:Fe-S cluster assembly protein SufD [gamma proteobacterium symbiont of Bathyaustriella thionipta]MCU7951728.1 Fe-S cluster assembly protein SufD [gamma proteobacterium symbiont of Bathyaustriella thionipta]MCU7958326.1 Fe-S cluster assembly protein SufD [gamma proteobacterium symbiont of Bathyaustriella thionipta]MCU7968788.1 Fe-S cluster assembly protein SufD [gamma proteobacterium symbiont of Bathyaustriella thionipta]